MIRATQLPAAVFKAYDIRGIVPDELDADFARRLGLALAQQARQKNIDTIAVGYDGRHTSPSLSQALQQGLREGGVNSLDLGLAPTPVLYYGAHTLAAGSGVAITGSHNPPNYNGFKMMLGGKTLYGPDVAALKPLMEGAWQAHSPQGQSHTRDLSQAYINEISNSVRLERPLKIAIDCGNGVGGVIAPKLYRALGCEVIELFCDVDGNFPNHHPDPADPANLQDLIAAVKQHNCDLGLAFDGDADRLGVVTPSGEIIWPDRQLILFAQDVLRQRPGATVIYDVKCSRHVGAEILKAGGQPLMWQTGHSLIKAKLAETQAPLAGEMSGHIFFNDRWYGFDDGLYTGARLLEILSRHAKPGAVLEALPKGLSTPELKLEMEEGEPHALIKRLQSEGQFASATEISTLDGVRAEYPQGFGLARASNTTPVVVLRFEGDTPQALETIKDEFRQALGLLTDRPLPF